ncbi:MAG TPA: protein translocase subunit SecF [Gemmatimonadales bacterium]|nr:protein translocase subunit SecF [Gemmatimonadales bacterium]
MIRLFANANYDFIGLRKWAYALTAAFILPGLALLLIRGLNYSIEFTGGTLIQVETARPTDAAVIRSALGGAGILSAEIQSFGSDREFVVRARLSPNQAADETATQETAAAVRRALDNALGAGEYTVVRTEAVGPKVGRELQGKALIAVLASFVVTLIYLAFRFEWRFGLAAVLATAHDILATIAFMTYLHLEISLIVVAAVLTVLGYSLNDTIVIFDRVRENLRKYRRQNLVEVLNLSINETLPRTVLTGGTTFATALVLSFWAGEVIKPFALILSFGIVVGTFSSIYVASPILLAIERRWPGQDARGVRAYRPAQASPTPPPSAPTPPGPAKAAV